MGVLDRRQIAERVMGSFLVVLEQPPVGGLAGFDIDVSGFSIGGGYAYPVSDTMDLVGRLAYVSTELEASASGDSGSVDDDGYSLGAGLRAMPIEQLEIEGGITYVDLSDAGDSTVFGIGARYYFVPQFAVGVAAGFGDDATSYGVSARWNFGAR